MIKNETNISWNICLQTKSKHLFILFIDIFEGVNSWNVEYNASYYLAMAYVMLVFTDIFDIVNYG